MFVESRTESTSVVVRRTYNWESGKVCCGPDSFLSRFIENLVSPASRPMLGVNKEFRNASASCCSQGLSALQKGM